MRIVLFGLSVGLFFLQGAESFAQQGPRDGARPNIYLDITPQPKDPCEGVYKHRSGVTINGEREPGTVRTAPNGHLPADGTLGCWGQVVEPMEEPLPPK